MSQSTITLKPRILGFFIWLAYRIWFSTWRLKNHESDFVKKLKAENKPWVIAMWHGDELAVVTFCRFYKVSTLTSTSKDGELMNQVVQRLGMKTSRGSSTRGGATALKGLLRLAKQGYSPVVPVDGPKGPIHKVKPGVFELAKILNLPIVAVGVHVDQKFVFEKSWNKAYMPLPFAQVSLVWGNEFVFDRNLDPRDPDLAKQLENQLDAMSRIAANLFAKP